MQNEDLNKPVVPAKSRLFVGGAVAGLLAIFLLSFLVLAGRNDNSDTADTPQDAPGNGVEVPGLSTSMETPASTEIEVDLVATEFSFDPKPIVLGETTTLNLHNEGAVLHNIVFEGIDDFVLIAEAGSVASADIALNPGEYVVFCSVPGHRAAGMESALTVE